jgi:hypothetical protein
VNIQTRLAELTAQIDVLATRRLNARKNRHWDLEDALYQQDGYLSRNTTRSRNSYSFRLTCKLWTIGMTMR